MSLVLSYFVLSFFVLDEILPELSQFLRIFLPILPILDKNDIPKRRLFPYYMPNVKICGAEDNWFTKITVIKCLSRKGGILK